ncbi:hypothetical protein [Nesterenkonia sp. K-15-9-6]|uniref:hypothetical protein n=1 Tax=Nesterenkonia sp. K-15-9-6 TaxID=3093918 RepID=UPI004044BA4E
MSDQRDEPNMTAGSGVLLILVALIAGGIWAFGHDRFAVLAAACALLGTVLVAWGARRPRD